jgi:GPI mannosyltransferase 1 subunit M
LNRWGAPFLDHSYFYHVGRTDHRHNFSPYFYPLYLGLTRSKGGSDTVLHTKILSLASFIPQMVISLGGGLFLSWSSLHARKTQPSHGQLSSRGRSNQAKSADEKDKPLDQALHHLPFVFFFQTFTFVMLNKVCTSQYFMWYLWFLPLVIPRLARVTGSERGISTFWATSMAILWVGSQALWLSYGYKLEFLGNQVFLELWASGIVMLLANAWILGMLLSKYRWIS